MKGKWWGCANGSRSIENRSWSGIWRDIFMLWIALCQLGRVPFREQSDRAGFESIETGFPMATTPSRTAGATLDGGLTYNANELAASRLKREKYVGVTPQWA